ncbi:MAG: hypothetical protein KDE27_24380, partial [Planctomycetes bacterium]|nr:hypothetical protein [Planctomycetota bacterium]
NSTGKLGDTWELDLASSTWTQFFPTQPPAARSNHSMAFDAGRGVVVLVGGDTANALALDEVWEWNGTTATWTRQDTRCLQQGRREAAMVSDPTRGVVLYGGQQANFGLLFDVWSPLTSSPASYSPIGMGCAPATAAVPSLTAVTLPWLDASFELRVSNAPAGGFVAPAVAILQAPTPIPLPFGPNCRSYLFGPFALPPIFASGAGVATITMNFPKKLNAFVGLNFYAQAAMLDSQTRVLLTNAGHAVLGRR